MIEQIITKLVAKEVINKLGMPILKSLFSSTMKDDHLTEASMTLVKHLNEGKLTSKADAKKLQKRLDDALERLDKNDYKRSTGTRVAQDLAIPALSGAAKTAGLGYYLYEQILPEVLDSVANAQKEKTNSVWNKGTSLNMNPLEMGSAYIKALNNFKGQTAKAGLDELSNIIDNFNNNNRMDSERALERQYYNDMSTASQNQQWSAAQWDALGKMQAANKYNSGKK